MLALRARARRFCPDRTMPTPNIPEDCYLYFGALGVAERQYRVPNFVGLALRPTHDREIAHDILEPLPFATGSIRKAQSQDVFEHIAYDALPPVLDEVFRVLAPGGVFRLSVPDYRSPVLRRRSVYDTHGRVVADLMMGGGVAFDKATGLATAVFREGGGAHLWFPRYELLLELIVKSQIRMCRTLRLYQGFLDDHRWIVDAIPDDEMHVKRAVPQDQRAGGRPVSLVCDFMK
jgi:SAM-dependent methyltransferase